MQSSKYGALPLQRLALGTTPPLLTKKNKTVERLNAAYLLFLSFIFWNVMSFLFILPHHKIVSFVHLLLPSMEPAEN